MVIVGFFSIILVRVCWCLDMVWKEIDCGVLVMFWIILVFCIGKKFLGMVR